jgi:hypothetical protein
MKYELTDETDVVFGVVLRRVRYVESGELGGWIESEDNLSQFGDARVFGDAWVFGNARVFGDARVYGNARVYGDAQVYGDARVFGNAQVFGDAWEKSPLQIQGTRFFFSVSSKTSLSIGCQTRTVDEWLETCESDFEEHHFTEAERVEYKLYFNLAATLYGWDVPLFQVGGFDKEGEA